MFVGQSVQRDGSLSAGTFEETFHAVVPTQTVILLHTTIRWLEVCVVTLEARKRGIKLTLPTFEKTPEVTDLLYNDLIYSDQH